MAKNHQQRPQPPPEKKPDAIPAPAPPPTQEAMVAMQANAEAMGRPVLLDERASGLHPDLAAKLANVPAPPGTPPKPNPYVGQSLDSYIAERDARSPGFAAKVEEQRGPTADEAQEQMLRELLFLLKPFQEKTGTTPVGAVGRLVEMESNLRRSTGSEDVDPIRPVRELLALLGEERDGDETPLAVLERVLREREEYRQQLQPAHNALGKHATARGLLVSFVKGSSQHDYDVGGRYRLELIDVRDGEVRISEAADVVGGVASHEMPYGLVRDHIEKRLEDFVTPKAHRS